MIKNILKFILYIGLTFIIPIAIFNLSITINSMDGILYKPLSAFFFLIGVIIILYGILLSLRELFKILGIYDELINTIVKKSIK